MVEVQAVKARDNGVRPSEFLALISESSFSSSIMRAQGSSQRIARCRELFPVSRGVTLTLLLYVVESSRAKALRPCSWRGFSPAPKSLRMATSPELSFVLGLAPAASSKNMTVTYPDLASC